MNTSKLSHQAHLAHWGDVIREQSASGLSIKDWCSENNISKHTYFYWKRKLKEECLDSKLPEIVKLQISTGSESSTTPTTSTSPASPVLSVSCTSCTTCTSSTTDHVDSLLPAIMPSAAENSAAVIVHIRDVSIEVLPGVSFPLLTEIIKAVRNA